MQAAVPAVPGEVCLANEFDPAWGEPPGTYAGIPLRFDSEVGAYAWDLQYTLKRIPMPNRGTGPVPGQAYWMERIPALYQQGYMLQPYRGSGSRAWQFRWIVKGKKVVCTPVPGSERRVPTLAGLGALASMGG